MSPRLAALAALIAALAAPAAQAMEGPAFGVSYGYALSGQGHTAYEYKAVPWGPRSEAVVRLVSRAQAIAPDGRSAFETSGLGLGFGGKLGPVHLGLDAEGAWLKRLAIQPANGLLAYQNELALLIEPYLTIELPFLASPESSLDLTLRYPVLRTDPGFGPRLMLTFWIGGDAGGAKKAPRRDGKDGKNPEKAPAEDENAAPGGGASDGPERFF